jgi:hypothetical protein
VFEKSRTMEMANVEIKKQDIGQEEAGKEAIA